MGLSKPRRIRMFRFTRLRTLSLIPGNLHISGGILAALIFLSIPLLFAIASEAYRGCPLTRSSLMRSFYTQCYLFAPFVLALWSFVLGALYFLTPANYGWLLISLFVAGFMFLWLIRNETNVIAQERQLRNRWWAFLIVLLCFTLIALAGGMMLILASPETFTQFMEYLYNAVVAGLFVTWIIQIFMKRRHKAAALPQSN